MQITIQTLKQHVPHKKAYSILDVIKNNMVSTEPTAVAGAVVYSFDLDEAISKFRELYLSDETNDKQAAAYWSYIELLKKMKDV